MHTLYLFVEVLCFLSLYSSLFAIFLHFNTAVLEASSANQIEKVCNLVQKNCNWKSIFQNIYKKIANSSISKSSTYLQSSTNKMHLKNVFCIFLQKNCNWKYIFVRNCKMIAIIWEVIQMQEKFINIQNNCVGYYNFFEFQYKNFANQSKKFVLFLQ